MPLTNEQVQQLINVVEQQKKEIAVLKTEQSQATSGLGRYIERATFYANMPKDPYGHQWGLINVQQKEIKHESDILSLNILLGNIGDDRTMLFFQNDIRWLYRFYDMGKRSPGVMDLFNTLYWGWQAQVRLTGSKGGMERALQSFLEPEIETSGGGFSILKKKVTTRKKKRNIEDYLVPQNENMY